MAGGGLTAAAGACAGAAFAAAAWDFKCLRSLAACASFAAPAECAPTELLFVVPFPKSTRASVVVLVAEAWRAEDAETAGEASLGRSSLSADLSADLSAGAVTELAAGRWPARELKDRGNAGSSTAL
jgi:hypothetical protein